MVSADNTLAAAVARVTAFLDQVRTDAKDGFSWTEFGRLLTQLLYLAVSALDAVTAMSGDEKKAIVLTAAASLFDSYADMCVPFVAWPAWVLIRPAVRVLILSLSSGAVEALLRISRSASA